MQPMANMWKTLASVATVIALLAPNAQAETLEDSPSAGAMVADAIVARPLYFALSQIGAAVYAVTLPFTLMGGNADQAAETLVVTPLQGAFVRCLGCGKIDSQVSTLSEVDGSKRIRHFVTLNAGMSFLDSDIDKAEGPSAGLFIGTHFALSDASRFDVLLGVKHLGDIEMKSATDTINDKTLSYQIVSRFGRDLGPFDLMFKLGGHYWDTERTAKLNTVAEGNTDGFGFLYGAGVDFWAGDSVRIGLEYTRYSLKNSGDDYKSGIDSADLNFSFLF